MPMLAFYVLRQTQQAAVISRVLGIGTILTLYTMSEDVLHDIAKVD